MQQHWLVKLLPGRGSVSCPTISRILLASTEGRREQIVGSASLPVQAENTPETTFHQFFLASHYPQHLIFETTSQLKRKECRAETENWNPEAASFRKQEPAWAVCPVGKYCGNRHHRQVVTLTWKETMRGKEASIGAMLNHSSRKKQTGKHFNLFFVPSTTGKHMHMHNQICLLHSAGSVSGPLSTSQSLNSPLHCPTLSVYRWKWCFDISGAFQNEEWHWN